MANRLAFATSPYLLQHASNPVDWWPWGPEAFVEARRRDVPVFLSVGYSSCHWCHVMAHESFDDEATAAQLNAQYVSIKVDREERPDIDAVYLAATTAMTGSAGWPMSVWLDHDARAFYAGTYFPPQPLPGRPSFRQVLAAVSDAWRQRRAEVLASAAAIDEALADAERPGAAAPVADTRALLNDAAAALAEQFDDATGGFGGAPKFPQAMALEFLLRHHESTGDPGSLAIVARACEAMARGGIHDQLAGGFARYSVDAHWQVPHFEKMLYDNALLLRLTTHLWAVLEREDAGSPAQRALVRRTAESTARFLLREMRTAEGGFAASLDADALPGHGHPGPAVEGASYVWTQDQLDAVLGPEDGQWAADLLGVTVAGTFEHGASTLTLRVDAADPARWERIRAELLAARAERPQPARDASVITGWNALTITALTYAGVVFDEPEWVDAAVAAADLLVTRHLVAGGRLLRVSRDGVAGAAPAMLDDHGLLVEALVTVAAATGEQRWLGPAVTVTEQMLDRFATDRGLFADSPSDGEPLVRRPRDPSDNATPSGTAAAAAALLLMAGLTERRDWRAAADATLANLAELQANHPRFTGWSLAALVAAVAGPAQVVVVGEAADAMTAALRRAAFRHAPGGSVLAALTLPQQPAGPTPEPAAALLAGRVPADGAATAYLCQDFVCRLPVTRAEELAAQLDALSGAG